MARQVELVRRIAFRVLAAGSDVVFDPGWERRGAVTFDPRGHTDHHTGTAGDIRRILREGHGRLPGPLCNYSIELDGLLIVIAAGRANHAGRGGYRGLTGNGSVLGTEITGDGSGFTAAQIATNDRLHVALAQEGVDVWLQHSHAEWAAGRKHDAAGPPHGAPGRPWDMDRVRARTVALLSPPPAPPAPAPDLEEDEDMYWIYRLAEDNRVFLARGARRWHQADWTLADALVANGVLDPEARRRPPVLPAAVVDPLFR